MLFSSMWTAKTFLPMTASAAMMRQTLAALCSSSSALPQQQRQQNVLLKKSISSAGSASSVLTSRGMHHPANISSEANNNKHQHFFSSVAGAAFKFVGKQKPETAEPVEKEAEKTASKEDIERLLQKHQVHVVSMPVRAEFVRAEPLTTHDLEAIDIREYHRKPENLSDHVAYRTVKFMRFFADAFFRKRYVHRAIVLETVAGVPGMVAGMLCHMKSLRRMQHDNGWVEKLLHEAENERMHLMIWMAVTKPTLLERCIVTAAQGFFFNAYMLYYLLFPRTAHRFVAYLEEEAIISYNAFAKEVLNGNIENTPAPKIAIDYYNLDKNARLIDVVYAVRADEAAHRDANHNFADKIDDK